MDFDSYRRAYFVEPAPGARFEFAGVLGAVLYFRDYEAAVDYYQAVLGAPAYVEGDSTRGWRIGRTWLTLLRGRRGGPRNTEVQFAMASPAEAERLQRAFIDAGGSGPAPSDQLMYEPIRSCPATDPFGTQLMIYSPL